jgi:undecaprenyl-diphosphatase
MLVGLSRGAAAEFSFLVAVPVLSAAALHEMFDAMQIFTPHELAILSVGFLVSFFSAIIAIKAFIGAVSRWSLRPFAWYRLLVVLLFGASYLFSAR